MTLLQARRWRPKRQRQLVILRDTLIGDGLLARQRKLTLVLQLSTPQSYEGGDLQVMPSANVLTANRDQGCVRIFPSFSLHQVTPVTNGIRHSLTVWTHGPSFR
ncbi:MAG: 2OG-Fe(II) oxygenase [Yoonia sp.]